MVHVIVSGFFNPIHSGHIQYIDDAYQFGLKMRHHCFEKVNLFIIVNNEIQRRLKNSSPFYDQWERRSIVARIFPKADVRISRSDVLDVCVDLMEIHRTYKGRHYFVNSGDRNKDNSNSNESWTCKEFGIKQIFLPGAKVNSSSSLIKNAVDWYNGQNNNN